MTMAEAMELTMAMKAEYEAMAEEFDGVPGAEEMAKNAEALRVLMAAVKKTVKI